MKDLKEINKILQEHERRISALEKPTGKNKSPTTKGTKQSLSDHIIELRYKGFFSQPKTAEEIHAKLTGKYHCELDRVAMALLRLAKRKELRKASKTSNNKKYKAYVW